MRSVALRVALLVLVGSGLVAASAAVGVFVMAQSAAPARSGELAVAGLDGPLRIERDPFGIPHVEAGSLEDAFSGLGFAHAQDRLWQMDLLRRHARGTLSEVFGASTLEQDRLARTLGLAQAAEAELASLPRRTRGLLEAYARGVNAWLAEVRALRVDQPFELRWLSYQIADWSAADTLALVRLRSWMLSRTLGVSLLLQRLLDDVGSTAARDFFPPRQIEAEPQLVGGLLGLGRVADRFAGGPGLNGPVGSLGFVVGGPRAASGQPLLANDSHLEFQIPPLAYLAHLRAPGLELAGDTWPGIPVFWMGANQRLAFGQVALHASASDLFDETLHPTDTTKYDRNGRWLDLELREEEITVRYREPERIVVRSTRHGPLLGPALPDSPAAGNWTLRWTGQARRSGIRALLAIQSAENWKEFRSALKRYPAPASSFLYADVDGNIGLQVAGHLPIRTIPTEFLPVPGRTRYYDWRGFIPFKELPSAFGDDIPFLVASTHPMDAGFSYPLAWLWRDGQGPERVRERLRKARRLELEDVLAIQRERLASGATEELRRILANSSPRAESGARIRAMLLEWNGATDTDSLGASVYHAFRQRLTKRLMQRRLEGHDELAEALAQAGPVPGAVLARFLERSRDGEAADLVDSVLDETWTWLGLNVSSNPKKWAWGHLHQLRLEHPLERLGGPLLAPAGRRLGRGPFRAPGDADSIWTMHHALLPTREVALGPVVRYAVDLADLGHPMVGLAGGQSGHPGAVHYDDAMKDWLAGRARPLWLHRLSVAYHSEGVWQLHPAPPEPYP